MVLAEPQVLERPGISSEDGKNRQPFQGITGKYPGMERRYFAMAVDFFAIVGIIIAAINALDFLGILSETTRKWALLTPLVLYEPVLTSSAATLGQLLFRFRVRKFHEANPFASLSRLNIFQAYARLVSKFLLGTISTLTMAADPRRRAIHDRFASSIVISTSQLRELAAAVPRERVASRRW